MDYEIEGIDPLVYQPLFAMSDAELAEREVVRMTVSANPGFPCRVSLRDLEEGASVLLVNHTSRADATPYRASHAIFVGEGVAEPARYRNEPPPVFARRVLSLRGFDSEGMMVDAVLCQPGEAELAIKQLFKQPNIVEIDAHNAARGCFSARIRRAS